jgi:hypothetical protein
MAPLLDELLWNDNLLPNDIPTNINVPQHIQGGLGIEDFEIFLCSAF